MRIAGRVVGERTEVECVVVLGVLVGEVEEAFDGRRRWRHIEQQGIGGRGSHERERRGGAVADEDAGVVVGLGACRSALRGAAPKESRMAATFTR
ncbi:hypothetical protein ACFW17_10345 [Streptomyces sp. NPDC058961]|uniref:hypothetical protein n=1 Tax=Streptomyces sp. NPDC058961 TaxID=3346680 RepID=UPI0036A57ACB